jgi:hypothetical protein
MFVNFYDLPVASYFFLKRDCIEFFPNAKVYDGLVLFDFEVGTLDFRLDMSCLGARYFGGDKKAGALINDALNVNVSECASLQDYLVKAKSKWFDEYELVAKYELKYDSQVEFMKKDVFKGLINSLRSILKDEDKDRLVHLDLFGLASIVYDSKTKHYRGVFGSKKVI